MSDGGHPHALVEDPDELFRVALGFLQPDTAAAKVGTERVDGENRDVGDDGHQMRQHQPRNISANTAEFQVGLLFG